MIHSDREIVYTHRFESPVGPLHIAVTRKGAVLRISYTEFNNWPRRYTVQENKYACGEVEYQLERYFTGSLKQFNLDLDISGTPFQKSVWARLSRIGYGSTISYGEVARKMGRSEAARAVGNAVAANPVAIVVPCHRVVPASGAVGAYALRSLPQKDGVMIKQTLLRLEGAL